MSHGLDVRGLENRQRSLPSHRAAAFKRVQDHDTERPLPKSLPYRNWLAEHRAVDLARHARDAVTRLESSEDRPHLRSRRVVALPLDGVEREPLRHRDPRSAVEEEGV